MKYKSYIIIDSIGNFLRETLSKALADIFAEKTMECLFFVSLISRSFHLIDAASKEGLQGVGNLKCISSVKRIDYSAFYSVLWKLIHQKTRLSMYAYG